MSLEKAIQENTAAVIEMTAAILDTGTVKTGGKGSDKAPAKGEKKTKTAASPEDQSEAKTEAKAQLAILLKEKGKDAVKNLLDNFKVKKFSELKSDVANVYPTFIACIKFALSGEDKYKILPKAKPDAASGDDDFLEGDPELTLETVKEKLVAIANHEKLGKDVARNILSDHGLKKIGEMKTDQFAAVNAVAVKVLAEVGA